MHWECFELEVNGPERSSCTLATNIIFMTSSLLPQLSEIKRLCYPLCTTLLSTKAAHALNCESIDLKPRFFRPCLHLSCLFHFFICLHLLSRPLSLPVCVRGNLDITPWPLTWPAMHSMCCEQDKLSRPALLRIVGEAPVHCNKSDLQPGSVRAAFILLKLCSVIKGYCTFPAFSCQ